VAFRTYLNNTDLTQTFRVNAVLNGRFESDFELPRGPLKAGAAIHVFDTAMFNAKLNASGVTAGQFLLSGYPPATAITPADVFQNLLGLFPGALLGDGRTFLDDGPFGSPITLPVSTGLITVGAQQLFTVMFDVATSSQAATFGGATGGGEVYFLDTLSPAPDLFTDADGNPVTGIVAGGSAPALSAPATTLTLTPATATNLVGATHTVTATAMTAGGAPVPDAIVRFSVTGGPNAGLVGGGNTDANGQATFTYAGNGGAGTDTIQAQIGALQSNTAQKTWQVPSHHLTKLSSAKVWVGLRNSDDVGTRVDILAEVFIGSNKVGDGQVNNVSTGSSGFNNAIFASIPLSLSGGPVGLLANSQLTLRASVRRTCFGGGHASGTLRLWYNGQPVDSGSKRDAGSRFNATIDGATSDYFLRGGSALSNTAGSSKLSIDVPIDSKVACPARLFKPFGTWSITLP
jgi:hypothetical protein